MVRFRRWSVFVLAGIGLFLIMQVVWWWQFYQTSQMVGQATRNLAWETAGVRLKRIEQLIKIYPLTTLGLYRLPYFFDGYQLAKQVWLLTETLIRTGQITQQLGNRLIKGSGSEISRVEEVELNVTLLYDRATILLRLIQAPRVVTLAAVTGQQESVKTVTLWLEQMANWLRSGQQLTPHLRTLLGYDQPRHYVVLLQNNMELRPTGGYLGSYADFWLDQGVLRDLIIQDIGWPNGQVKGYVEEPEPIRKYLFQGQTPGWRLRDSNWEVDFTQAAQDIAWFFNEGGVKEIDTLVAVNLLPVQWFLETAGPVKLLDYGVTVTPDNFYQLAQEQAEAGFFPGSTQKSDFLGAVGRQLLYNLQTQPEWFLPLLKVVNRGLAQKQVMIAELSDPLVQATLSHAGWDGALLETTCVPERDGCVADYLYLNEANLGINKTNCCLDRSLTDQVEIGPKTGIKHTLTIDYINHNPLTPKPPIAWGGGYQNYLRLVIPRGANLHSVRVNDELVETSKIDLNPIGDKMVIGFLVGVAGNDGQTRVEINYQVPFTQDQPVREYQLIEQKQSGIDLWPVNRQVNGREIQDPLQADRRQTFELKEN